MESVMKWWFHREVQNVHLLFDTFRLDSNLNLFFGYLFIVAICWTERGISFYMDQVLERRKSWKTIVGRTALYGLATTLRLWYMLITMYFNTGLFIMVVISLTSAQLAVEYFSASRHDGSHPSRASNSYAPIFKEDHDATMHGSTSSDRDDGKYTRKTSAREEEQRLYAVPNEAYEMGGDSYEDRR